MLYSTTGLFAIFKRQRLVFHNLIAVQIIQLLSTELMILNSVLLNPLQ